MPHRKHLVLVTKISRLIICRETFAVDSEIPRKFVTTLLARLTSFRRVVADLLLLLSPIRLSVCMCDNLGTVERIFMKLSIGKLKKIKLSAHFAYG
jgi:hypothetical protein